jgi:hypothetical protein
MEHEVWMNSKGESCLCFAHSLGLECADALADDYKVVHRFFADSHFEAMTIYHTYMKWPPFTTTLQIDHEPYDLTEILERSMEYISTRHELYAGKRNLRPIPGIGPARSNEFEGHRQDHSVIIYFAPVPSDPETFYDLALEIGLAMHDNPIGYYDGHELDMDDTDGRMFFYGPDGEALLKHILPMVNDVPWLHGAHVTVRFGGLDDENPPELELRLPIKI